MRVAPRQPELREKWDAFVLAHPLGWFWHTNEWIDYALLYRGGTDLSMVILSDDETVLALAVMIQEGEVLSMGGDPLPWPLGLVPDFEEPIQVRFRSCPLADSPYQSAEDFIREGYNIETWRSRVIDLTQSEADLHAGLRKSYTSLVNKACREYTMAASHNLTEAMAFTRVYREAYQDGIFEQARPVETDAIYERWATSGTSLVVVAYRRDDPTRCVGGAQFFCYKQSAYYAAGAYVENGVAPGIIWTAILELKQRGIERLEIGWQDWPCMSDKERGIANFKCGFGGQPEPMLVVSR